MADDPDVKVFMLRNVPYQGQILHAGGVYAVPKSVATEMRDRNALRKPSKEEIDALYKAPAKTPQFGDEPAEEPAAAPA